LLLLAYIALVLSGVTWGFFASALILMGIGWNFLYVGGTSLLATTYSAAEKGVAQAANDMSVFIFSLICSLGAGPLFNAFGWKTMHLILVPWIISLIAPVLWLIWHKRRAVRPALK
ncbi:TPA: MFS transporter, partial [Escherichia coli]|nr:MFS transporter [Escherichia coli]